MTSMSSQLGSLSFINEGSTRRKEILAKFLDLETFDKKFKLNNQIFYNLNQFNQKLTDMAISMSVLAYPSTQVVEAAVQSAGSTV